MPTRRTSREPKPRKRTEFFADLSTNSRGNKFRGRGKGTKVVRVAVPTHHEYARR